LVDLQRTVYPISGHPSATGQVQDRKVRRGKTDVLPLCYATTSSMLYTYRCRIFDGIKLAVSVVGGLDWRWNFAVSVRRRLTLHVTLSRTIQSIVQTYTHKLGQLLDPFFLARVILPTVVV